jgi:hypothetical protein
MTRMSKQGERRSKSPHKPRPPAEKTGPRKDSLTEGYKPHMNALESDIATKAFIP